jgi:hypothetical protein
MKEMTCKEFDEVVHGIVRIELLDVSVREAALEHTAHCRSCAARMAAAIALAEASETVARSVRDQETPPRVQTALLAAFRNHHRRAVWRRSLEWASVGAAAAVLLVFLWTVGLRSKGQPSPTPRKDISQQSTEPLDAKGLAVAPQAQPAQAEASADVAGPSTRETYVASDFVPVPFTGAINSDDPGMVVRVQLTRASLAQLGYPVAETPDEDLIRADVLVGEDGWPRGVRLVQ